ncbi:MAG: hypothetical protein SGJ10_08100 [Bacteroidota bacterium]|nr:hypothetical protein [Bacteroidota bacterium]
MNKKILIIIIFATSMITKLEAQWVVSSVGFQVGPSFGYKFQKAANTNTVPGFPFNYKQMSDSTNKTDQFRVGYDLGFNAMFNGGGTSFFQIGLQYRTIGFRRLLVNLQYLDSIQYFGLIDGHSQTGSKDVRYKYQYHMIELPITYCIGMQNIEKMFDPFTWFITVGVTPSFLFANTMWARCYGFDIDGVNQISRVKDVNFNYKKFMVFGNIGAKFMYRHPENDNLKFSLQPTIYIPTTSITAGGSGINMWIPSINLHAGINYSF